MLSQAEFSALVVNRQLQERFASDAFAQRVSFYQRGRGKQAAKPVR